MISRADRRAHPPPHRSAPPRKQPPRRRGPPPPSPTARLPVLRRKFDSGLTSTKINCPTGRAIKKWFAALPGPVGDSSPVPPSPGHVHRGTQRRVARTAAESIHPRRSSPCRSLTASGTAPAPPSVTRAGRRAAGRARPAGPARPHPRREGPGAQPLPDHAGAGIQAGHAQADRRFGPRRAVPQGLLVPDLHRHEPQRQVLPVPPDLRPARRRRQGPPQRQQDPPPRGLRRDQAPRGEQAARAA